MFSLSVVFIIPNIDSLDHMAYQCAVSLLVLLLFSVSWLFRKNSFIELEMVSLGLFLDFSWISANFEARVVIKLFL